MPSTKLASLRADYEPSKWAVVCAASAVLFVGIGYSNTYGVFQEYHQQSLFPEEPAEKLIVIGSVAASLYFILGVFTGRLADLIGYRWNLLMGAALMVGSMFAASVSRVYWQLFLSQGFIFGLGVAFVYPPVTSMTRHRFGPTRYGLANGIVVSGGALGGTVLPYCVQEMIKSLGLPQTFRVLGYIAAGILVPSIVVLSLQHQSRPQTTQRQKLFDTQLLHDRRFLMLAVACTIAMTGFLPRYFLIPSSANFKGIDPTYGSWLLGMMNGLSIIGRVGIGYTADRIGPQRALAASFMLCAIGHLAFWVPAVGLRSSDTTTPTALMTVFVVFVGILGSGFISLFPVVMAHLFGKGALASKTGLLNSFVGVSTLAGPSAVHAIVQEGSTERWILGTLAAGLFVFAGGFILLVASVTTFKETRPSRTRDSSGISTVS